MFASFDTFEIELTKDQAHTGSHQGQCDSDIEYLLTVPKIRRQLAKIDPAKIVAELKGYGAWNEEALKDTEQNLRRILWIACSNVVENL